ncbi:hypothetical protein HOC01_03780 [archaeon]|jgi:hypothetical protein|nr:hypothetical protein [archaeon]MBT6698468.1 hypothetical protein [archaeon]
MGLDDLARLFVQSIDLYNDLSEQEDDSHPGYTQLQSLLAGFHGDDFRESIQWAVLSYPRVCYETAFLTGQRAYFDIALELTDGEIKPVNVIPVHYLVSDDDGGISCGYNEIEMEGDFLVWKSWRDLTLRKKIFTEDRFPTYDDAELDQDVLLLNQDIQIGALVSNSSVNARVKSRKALSNNSGYRFQYKVEHQ